MESSQRPLSPCQGICRFDDDEKCIGCFRQRQDIDNWFYLSEVEKQAIIDKVNPLITANKKKGR